MNDPFAAINSKQVTKPKREQPPKVIVMPVPSDAPEPPSFHGKLGVPSQCWTYRNAEGKVLGYVCRFDEAGEGKSYRPLCLFRVGERLQWRWETWPQPRPLYGLDLLVKAPDTAVVIVEGEKAADAVRQLLLKHVCISSPGGSNAAKKADWSGLEGRKVFIWPDADEAGQRYADDVAGCLVKFGAASVTVLVSPDNVPKGWDAADALADGWTPEQAEAFVQSSQVEETQDPEAKPRSRGVSLLSVAQDLELWHSPQKDAFASVLVNDHYEHWSVDSQSFKRWLVGRYYEKTGLAPSTQNLGDALRVFEVRALEQGACHEPFMRTGWQEGETWLDLADESWRAVRITRNGWEVVQNPPVKFIRKQTMSPLPEPEKGHQIEEMRHLINAEDEDYKLIIAWMVASLWGRSRSYPVLALGGEQGSGKSTMARLIRSLADPCAVSASSLPKDERDLMVMAQNGHVLNFDNVSKMESWLSDAICRMATGSGFISRKLHTDGDAYWFQGARPVLLNGIPALTERADLAERALSVRLKRIDEVGRQPEELFWQEWEHLKPGMLGALLDALSTAIRNIESVHLDRHPRMADFARLMVAASTGLGWKDGEFLEAYESNRRGTAEAVFEGDPVAVALHEFLMVRQGGESWVGTATELLAELNVFVSDQIRSSRFWPQKVNAFGNAVERVAPLLRQKQIQVAKKATGSRRLIYLDVI
ncbi:hypothetical protein PsAD2_00490 [Pseudovibrio axinellae]|uniref:Toprim domain-containing protein n=1 Tax=Pseudovibrio axinellae TaxID=989403 RepID=A0A166AJP0_9HYPH|nr:ATP-binding protein [Pseudovibrio axinellae]KZL21201.1 hypothetical protein PsAD2_00490 [Pseudovibrio axinellae]SEQ91762.1 hypothetical protein SAMN05421798_105113 [Pseudovibrio axinellae]